MTFSERFDSLMESNGVSNYRLSKEIDAPDSSIGYWRKGTRQPALENLLKIASFFVVSTDYLLCRTDDPRTPEHHNDKLTPHEKTLIDAYRANPAMHEAVDKLLGI